MPVPGTRLDAPPQSPPEVTGQMGMSGVGEMLGNQLKGQQPPDEMGGGVNPQGALLAQFNALEKVINQMASQNEKFAPYAFRAIAILKEGLGSAIGQSPNQPEQPMESMQSPATGQAGMEGNAGAGFVG